MNHPQLFGAAPIGRGTPAVEALSSFFARLCIARYVPATQIARRMVLDGLLPAVNDGKPYAVDNSITTGGGRIDLHCTTAEPWAAAVGRYAGLSGLDRHTFAACSMLWVRDSALAMGKVGKRWCPACFKEQQATTGLVYEPLLWRFGLVDRCPVHAVRLIGACPVCGARQPIVTHKVPCGHCGRCGHLLCEGLDAGRVAPSSLDPVETWSLWEAVALSRVLAWTSAREDDAPSVSTTGVERLLRHALEAAPAASGRSPSGLKALLGAPGHDLFGQLALGGCPTLKVVLDASMQLGVDPVRVLNGEFEEGERTWPRADGRLPSCPDPWTFALEVRETKNARLYPEHVVVLDQFIAEPRAVDLADRLRLARMVPHMTAARFPLRFERANALRVHRLERGSKTRVEAYAKALDREIDAGAPRSYSEFLRATGFSRASLGHYVPERVAELVALRRSARRTQEARFRAEGRAALVAALEEPQIPTLVEIGRRFGVADYLVKRVFPAESLALRAAAENERRARRARHRAAMRRELARPSPRGVRFVAERLGTDCAVLLRADPTLYDRLRLGGPARRPKRATLDQGGGRRRDTSDCVLRALATALRKEAKKPEPRTAAAVAKEQGVSKQMVYVRFPELVQALRHAREVWLDERFDQAAAIIEKEICASAPRSLEEIARDVDLSRMGLSNRFPELRDRLTQARRLERVCPPVTASTRKPKEDYLATLRSEIASANPRSVAEVARSLGASARRLRRAELGAVRELVAVRRARSSRRRRAVQARIRKALERELALDGVRPLTEIARGLGLSDGQVVRGAPDFARAVIDKRLGRTDPRIMASK